MDLVAISRLLFSFSMNSQIFETLFRVHLSTQFDVLGSSGRFATNLKKWDAFRDYRDYKYRASDDTNDSEACTNSQMILKMFLSKGQVWRPSQR